MIVVRPGCTIRDALLNTCICSQPPMAEIASALSGFKTRARLKFDSPRKMQAQ